MQNKLLAFTIPLLACASVARPTEPQFSAERFRAHVAFLSDDLLEGRDTSSRGQELGARYVANQLAALGLHPGGNGGADIIKVIASGAVLAYGGVPGDPEMTPAEIAAVVQVAHAAGRKVAAHAHGAQSIKDAILAGVDTIEHASLIDTEGRRQHWPEEFLRKNVETTEIQRRTFTLAHAAGVAIVFGTDAAVYPHGLNARQFPIMVARGMTPMEAIRSASSVAARYMGWGDRIGRLAPGYFGDLIAIEGDPLQDVTRLQRVTTVLKGGLVFKNSAVSRE
jgi:imidazolonepropionase-like amidohydrolase